MAAVIVRAPQPVTENVCGVPFVDGVAHVNPAIDGHRRALAYFRQAGYTVEDLPAVENEPAAEEPSAKPARTSAKKEA